MELRIVKRQQRTAAQLDEAAEPHAPERERQQHVEPAEDEAVAVQLGAISQNRSMSRTTITPIATFTSSCGLRLTARDSRIRNGSEVEDDEPDADHRRQPVNGMPAVYR